MIFSVLIIWILYSILEGKREAIFWHHKINSADYEVFKDKDRHPLFVLQRGLVLSSITIATYYIWDNFWLSGYIALMNMLLFSFFHNGAMYTQRHQMHKEANPRIGNWVYPKQWWDQSTTSTAKLTKFMGPISRTVQAIIGLIGYILYSFQ